MRKWRHTSKVAILLRVCCCGISLLAGTLLHAGAYNSLINGTNNVIIPNDGDSPYTLSAIAVDIANAAIFAWHADSNSAVCAANMCISGTVHIGKVNAAGNYDAAGNEEKLFMSSDKLFQISITNGGVLIARGFQGTNGVRRSGTDTLTNEISVIPGVYPKKYRIEVGVGGTIKLYDTKTSWCAASGANWPGFYVNGGEFDIQRCQLYNYQHYAPAITIETAKDYTNPVFRDNYLGSGFNASVGYNRPGIRFGWYSSGSPTNIEIINCEFDANDTTSGQVLSVGNIMVTTATGIKIRDCLFSRGCPIGIYSTSEADVELRNCEYGPGAIRTPLITGAAVGDNAWTRQTYYLNCHVVNLNATNKNVDTGDSDMVIEEQTSPTNLNGIYRFTGGGWAAATNSSTTGTDATGWTPNPGSEGAIMLTETIYEMVDTVVSTNYYCYNLRIPTDRSFSYHPYDYYSQHGEKYITSIDVGGATNDECIGPGWYRSDALVPNPEPFLNDPPTNGTWYVGMDPKIRGTLFSFH